MASLFSRPYARFFAGGAAAGIVGGIAYARSQPVTLDSGAPPSRTLTFPKNMPLSKQLKVTATEQVNHDTRRITFALPGGMDEVSGVAPGGAILTQHTPPNAWFPVFRPYTPVHDLDERGVLQLLVKKYPNGRASGHMHSLAPGDELTVRGPIPSYTWKPSPKPQNVLLVAGGAGITPIYSLAKGILANPDDQTKMQLLWGVNGTTDITLRTELEALQQRHPERLKVTYVVSGPEGKAEAPSLGDEDKFIKGYIDTSVVQKSLKRMGDRSGWGDVQGTQVFFCGPPGMQEGIAGKKGLLMGELGFEKKAVHCF
ncbi:hypothetical protein MBLNU230_g4743t1 [Neophaeotheca triangularis]